MENVYEVDANYAAYFQSELERIRENTNAILQLAGALSPGSVAALGAPALFASREGFIDYLDDFPSLEKAMDHAMQDAVFELRDSDERFSPEVWQEALDNGTIKELVTQFYAEVQKIMGTSANPELVFEVPYTSDGEPARAMYSFSTGTITINPYQLASMDKREKMIEAILHETRHAYQYEAVSFHTPLPYEDEKTGAVNRVSSATNYIVSENTRNHWLVNMYDLIEPDEAGYKTQPIEWDAFSFSGGNLRNETPPLNRGSW